MIQNMTIDLIADGYSTLSKRNDARKFQKCISLKSRLIPSFNKHETFQVIYTFKGTYLTHSPLLHRGSRTMI